MVLSEAFCSSQFCSYFKLGRMVPCIEACVFVTCLPLYQFCSRGGGGGDRITVLVSQVVF